jgi:hypothetical protein
MIWGQTPLPNGSTGVFIAAASGNASRSRMATGRSDREAFLFLCGAKEQ